MYFGKWLYIYTIKQTKMNTFNMENLTFELTWISNGHNYSQDFETFEMAYNEYKKMAQLNVSLKVYTEKHKNWDYQVCSGNKEDYVMYVAKDAKNCKSGAWGTVGRFVSMLNGRNYL